MLAEAVTIETGVPMPEIYTVAEAERALKVSRTTIYKLIESRELTRINVGKKALILGIREFIERKAAEARQGEKPEA